MSGRARLLLTGCVAIALLLWIAHLFLPVLERTTPTPGWVQIFLVFFPAGLLLVLSHVLFLAAVANSAFQRWAKVVILMVVAAALLMLCRPGPITYSGVQALWAAYLMVFLSGVAGLALRKRADR